MNTKDYERATFSYIRGKSPAPWEIEDKKKKVHSSRKQNVQEYERNTIRHILEKAAK